MIKKIINYFKGSFMYQSEPLTLDEWIASLGADPKCDDIRGLSKFILEENERIYNEMKKRVQEHTAEVIAMAERDALERTESKVC